MVGIDPESGTVLSAAAVVGLTAAPTRVVRTAAVYPGECAVASVCRFGVAYPDGSFRMGMELRKEMQKELLSLI